MLLITRKIKLIYPYKMNQKDKNTIEDRHGLQNRLRVEHVNNFLHLRTFKTPIF